MRTLELPTDNGVFIANLIVHGNLYCISDGSYKKGHGTPAYILQSDTNTGSWIGTLPCHGHNKDHDAYRAELSGLFGVVTALSILCTQHNIHTGEATKLSQSR